MRDVKPEQYDDDAADGAVRAFVIGEVGHVDLEEERDQQPENRSGNGAWRDPHPVLIRIRSEVVNEPDPGRDKSEHQRPLQDQPRPLEGRAPPRTLSQLLCERQSDEHQRQRDKDDQRHAECQPDRDEAGLPPGRPSSMSYARFSAPTIETSAAELLHSAPATPIAKCKC
jgi:hypothetical protein